MNLDTKSNWCMNGYLKLVNTIMGAYVLWNAALEVVDASLGEEICGQNVLPFVYHLTLR